MAIKKSKKSEQVSGEVAAPAESPSSQSVETPLRKFVPNAGKEAVASPWDVPSSEVGNQEDIGITETEDLINIDVDWDVPFDTNTLNIDRTGQVPEIDAYQVEHWAEHDVTPVRGKNDATVTRGNGEIGDPEVRNEEAVTADPSDPNHPAFTKPEVSEDPVARENQEQSGIAPEVQKSL